MITIKEMNICDLIRYIEKLWIFYPKMELWKKKTKQRTTQEEVCEVYVVRERERVICMELL